MECLTELKKLKENTSSWARREGLEEHLCAQIETGQLKEGDKISTEELAIEWNISKGTVNQSLNMLASRGILVRKPRAGTFVGKSSDASLLSAQNKKNISLILPDLTQPEFLYVFQYLQQAANGSVYNVNAFGTDDNIEQYTKIISEQIEANVGAIVLIPPLFGALPVELLIKLYESNIPVLTCFRTIEGFGWPVVRVDQAYNTQIAAKHLCEIGRKNIGLVSLDVPNSYNDLIKEYTFINTLDEFGLPTKKSLRLTLSRTDRIDPEKRMWLFNAIDTVENWLEENPEIDGICCLHDMGAWAVFAALAKIGKKVPEDVAVVGNGNMLDFFGFVQNDLTTVDCCYDDLGTAIFNFVNDVCSGKSYAPNSVIEVKGKLILRYSTHGILQNAASL